jgi:hypothetical protein
MRRVTSLARAVLALAVLASGARGVAAEDTTPETTGFGLGWAQGAVVKVEQTLELENTNRGAATFAGGAGRSEIIVKGLVTIREEWTDKVTAVAEGSPRALQRTYKSSKLRAQKRAADATSLQGCVIELAREGTATTVKATKGKPGDLPQKLLAAAPLDPVELLLPREALAVGATWTISVEALKAFQTAICIGCSGARGSTAEDVRVLLAQLDRGGPAAIGKLVIGTFKSLEDGKATLTFLDDKTHDSDAPMKGPLFDVPPTKTTIEGTLTWDVAGGRPIKLEWKQLYVTGDFTPPPSIGGPTMPGFKENWVLQKSWE